MVVLDLPHTIFHYIVVRIAGLDLFSGRAKGELIDSCIGRPAIANVYLPVDDFSLIRNSKRQSRQNMSRMSGKGKMKKHRYTLGFLQKKRVEVVLHGIVVRTGLIRNSGQKNRTLFIESKNRTRLLDNNRPNMLQLAVTINRST